MANTALEILTGLIIKYAGGKACSGTVKAGEELDKNYEILFNIKDCNDFLGTSLNEKEVETALNKVNINYSKNDSSYTCLAPSYRSHDIERDVDIYEEIARVVGFNNIKNSESFSINYTMINEKEFNLIDSIKNILSSNGFFEHYSNSLISDEEHDFFSQDKGISLSNPLNKNMQYIRNSIAPGLLKAISFNQNRKIKNYKLFEVGATYQSLDKSPPEEDMRLGIAWPHIQFDNWGDKEKYNFFNSKGDLDSFLDCLNIDPHSYFDIDKKGFEVCYSIKSKKIDIGFIGLINSKILKQSDVKKDLIYSEISINKLNKALINRRDFEEPSIYPSIERDISLLVSNKYNAKKLTDTIKKAGGKFLNEVYLFDVYADNSFNSDMKSYAFKMIFQSKTNTLKDSEIDTIIQKVLNKLKQNYNVVQR